MQLIHCTIPKRARTHTHTHTHTLGTLISKKVLEGVCTRTDLLCRQQRLLQRGELLFVDFDVLRKKKEAKGSKRKRKEAKGDGEKWERREKEDEGREDEKRRRRKRKRRKRRGEGRWWLKGSKSRIKEGGGKGG